MIFDNNQDTTAYQAGWLVCLPGEIYEIQISRSTSLFIIQNTKNRFDVVRLTWKKGFSRAIRKKYRARNVSFETAIRTGGNYILWLKNHRKT